MTHIPGYVDPADVSYGDNGKIDRPPMLRPSINIRVEYRQIGAGPESIEVQWDDGMPTPSAEDICNIVSHLVKQVSEPVKSIEVTMDKRT